MKVINWEKKLSKSDGERFIVIENKLIWVDQNILPSRDNLIFISLRMCVCLRMSVCRNERKKDIVCANVCVCVYEDERERDCMCTIELERVSACVCVIENERKRER